MAIIKDSKNNSIPRRRFGRTEIQIPVLSLGGMRFQQSWKDLDPKEINNQQQEILQKTISYAAQKGMHHIETALSLNFPPSAGSLPLSSKSSLLAASNAAFIE